MQISEIVLACTTLLAVATAVAGIIRDRRKPSLDAAQAENTLVNSESIKTMIREQAEKSNYRRDLRILDLEKWGDEMRPWASAVSARDNQMLALIREDRERLGLPMPNIEPLPEPPTFPPPRAL